MARCALIAGLALLAAEADQPDSLDDCFEKIDRLVRVELRPSTVPRLAADRRLSFPFRITKKQS